MKSIRSRKYKTVSLYFSDTSEEDQLILQALQNKNKVGTSTSGLIKQILFNELVEAQNIIDDINEQKKITDDMKQAKQMLDIFGMREI